VPELPEVETMRRGIAALEGTLITAARFPSGRRRPLKITPRPALLASLLIGSHVAAVERYGKRIAIRVVAGSGAAARWLVIEPRMTGLLLLVEPPTTDHVRMVVDLDAGVASHRLHFWDQRGLGTIRLVDAAGLERVCGAATLGKDGLVIDAGTLARRLGTSRRAVKVALLDQRAVAGIGNIYAAEILHRAGIDPRSACRRLSAGDWNRIAAWTRRVLAAAVRHEGSSIGDELYRTADDRKGRFQRLHRVYGREGCPCRRCHTPIERIVQAQRSTFFCPACQSGRGGRSRVAATRRRRG